jgi:hypothetical protein
LDTFSVIFNPWNLVGYGFDFRKSLGISIFGCQAKRSNDT